MNEVNNEVNMEKLKPFLNEFIRFYYNELQNCTGGYLNIATFNRNLSEQDIWDCQELAMRNGDSMGYFIATLMRHFTEEELEELYDNGWWGMERSIIKEEE